MLAESRLSFRYAETEGDGRLLLSERLTWDTRAGSGINL